MTNFSKWLSKKIKNKKKFTSRSSWTMRDLNRWCHGKNVPNLYKISSLLEDIAVFSKQQYSSVLEEAFRELQKDYKQKNETKTN
tara:strand:- start:1686 stop:1937 length:252 start_codon:yes stop_codon:yes gene_type:complete